MKTRAEFCGLLKAIGHEICDRVDLPPNDPQGFNDKALDLLRDWLHQLHAYVIATQRRRRDVREHAGEVALNALHRLDQAAAQGKGRAA